MVTFSDLYLKTLKKCKKCQDITYLLLLSRFKNSGPLADIPLDIFKIIYFNCIHGKHKMTILSSSCPSYLWFYVVFIDQIVDLSVYIPPYEIWNLSVWSELFNLSEYTISCNMNFKWLKYLITEKEHNHMSQNKLFIKDIDDNDLLLNHNKFSVKYVNNNYL